MLKPDLKPNGLNKAKCILNFQIQSTKSLAAVIS